MTTLFQDSKIVDGQRVTFLVSDRPHYFSSPFEVLQQDLFDDGDIAESPLQGFDDLKAAIAYAQNALAEL